MARRTLTLTEEQRQELLRLRDHDARPYVRERGAALPEDRRGPIASSRGQAGAPEARDPDTVYPGWTGTRPRGPQG